MWTNGIVTRRANGLLSVAEWLEALIVLLGCAAALKLFGIERVSSVLDRVPARRSVPVSTAAVDRWKKLMEAAAELQPFRARCLHQCLALYWILRRRGMAVELLMGVHKFPFRAHVWLEYQGKIVHTALPAAFGERPMQGMSIILHLGRQPAVDMGDE